MLDETSWDGADHAGADHADAGDAPAADAPAADAPHAAAPVLLTDEEARVLGCLLEKERTTPDDYPLTANALMRACNQSTSRDPVVAYDQRTVEGAVASLKAAGLVRFVHMPSGRAVTKYRHVAGECFSLDQRALAVVCLLLLRGPQTVGELKTRSERLAAFADLGEVSDTLDRLAAAPAPFVVAFERAPGQKEQRWAHLLCGTPEPPTVAVGGSVGMASGPTSAQRIAALELEVEDLRSDVNRLRSWADSVAAELGIDRPPLGGDDFAVTPVS
ncbi:MAG: DUF480 domain-containing protein [Actinobacteria bacterium]|nr:DUF480 domain-containing protein [Actinomycetota bacterium]